MEIKNEIMGILEKFERFSTSDYELKGDLHGCVLSLASHGVIEYKQEENIEYKLTEDGETVIKNGTPEYNLISKITEEGIDINRVDVSTRNYAFKNKWVEIKDDKLFLNKNVPLCYFVVETLKKIKNGDETDANSLQNCLKRKFIRANKTLKYEISRGSNYNCSENYQTEISFRDVIDKVELNLKPINFQSIGIIEKHGALHPLMKMKTEIKNIFLSMGFTEMKTDNYVESAFWNFDALFQPQSHPSRDAHDTFFVDKEDYFNIDPGYYCRVRNMHENVYMNKWKSSEANKLVMRTHTTASSARTLFELAKDFKPSKFFSIDRVFRNESVDATHLAEFHQIEGVIIDRNLNISHLMGILSEFFKRMKIENIKFKPTYNPYTEPSMEIFAVHDTLGLIEVGNSGIFRPEMLIPMGFDADIRAIAWGLSLERPAMIKYGVNNIRELMGHKVDLDFVKDSKIIGFD